MRGRGLATVYHLALSLAIAGAGLGCSGGSDGSTGGASSGGTSGMAGATGIGGSAQGGSGGESASGGDSGSGGVSGSGNAAGVAQGGAGGAVGGAMGGTSGEGGTNPSRPLGSWVEIDATLSATTPVKLDDGAVLLVGGFSSDVVFRFEPSDNSVTRLNPLPELRGNFAVSLLEDGRVLIVGGNNADERDGFASCLLYDPAMDVWTPTGALPAALYELQAIRLPDGDVIAMGGARAGVGGLPSSDVYRYSVENGEWETLAALDETARYHKLFLLGQDHVLVASPNPQVYDLVSQSVVLSPSFDVYREFFVAVQLANENVIVAGGTPLGSDEEPYDFVSQFEEGATTWTELMALPTPKYNHSAVALNDGTVLVVGGVSALDSDSDDPSRRAADRYIPSLDAWFPEEPAPASVGGGKVQLLDDGSALFISASLLRFYPEAWQ